MVSRNKKNAFCIKNSPNIVLWAAFLLSFFICIVIAMVCGIAPFGDRTLILSDSTGQFTSFWAYYRDIILGKQDVFYALEKTMGGNIIGLLAYYCASPFNLIFALFPLEQLPIALHIIVLLKICCCSLTMAVFLKYTTGLGLKSLIFTTAYAFCAYNSTFFWAAMWLDGVVMLPLIALGLHNIRNGKSTLLYILSLAAAILANYYIGFMLCIFSVLYFAYLMLLEIKELKKPEIKCVAVFSVSSLAAGALSACLLIPTMLSMQDSKRVPFKSFFTQYTYSTSLKILEMLCPERAAEFDSLVKYVLLALLIAAMLVLAALAYVFISRKTSVRLKTASVIISLVLLALYACVLEPEEPMLQNLLFGYRNFADMYEGMPSIYAGVLPLILSIYYFLSKEIPSKHKTVSMCFVLVMLVSMRFYVPNLVWHGFTQNSGFSFRYSFIFSFFLLVLASQAFEKIKGFELKHAAIIALVIALIAISGIIARPDIPESNKYIAIISGVLFLTAIYIYIYIYATGSSNIKNRKAVLLFITVVHIVVVAFNSYVNVNLLTCAETAAAVSSYSGFKSGAEKNIDLCEALAAENDEMYRVSINSGINAPMMYNYNGVTHFSSTEEKRVVNFMNKVGIGTFSNVWASGNSGRSRAFDSLFGVKYLNGGTDVEDYTMVENTNIYSNPYALPIAFQADYGLAECVVNSDDDLFNLNSIFRSIYPELDKDVFEAAEPSLREEERLKEIGDQIYWLVEDAQKGDVRFTIDIESSDPLYLHIKNGRSYAANIYINGEFYSKNTTNSDWRPKCLGRFEPGEQITVSLELEREAQNYLAADAVFYYESSAALKEYYEHITAVDCVTVSETDSHLTTTANIVGDNKLLLYTIPHETSWKVYVDGKKAETVPAAGIFLAVPVPEGEHVVEMVYVPRGLYLGITISAFTTICIIAVLQIKRKKQI